MKSKNEKRLWEIGLFFVGMTMIHLFMKYLQEGSDQNERQAAGYLIMDIATSIGCGLLLTGFFDRYSFMLWMAAQKEDVQMLRTSEDQDQLYKQFKRDIAQDIDRPRRLNSKS